MTYLIVGLDRTTLAPWHRNVSERDAASATRAALERAGAHGVDLVVAAVIGAHSTVLEDHTNQSVRLLNAAWHDRARPQGTGRTARALSYSAPTAS